MDLSGSAFLVASENLEKVSPQLLLPVTCFSHPDHPTGMLSRLGPSVRCFHSFLSMWHCLPVLITPCLMYVSRWVGCDALIMVKFILDVSVRVSLEIYTDGVSE